MSAGGGKSVKFQVEAVSTQQGRGHAPEAQGTAGETQKSCERKHT